MENINKKINDIILVLKKNNQPITTDNIIISSLFTKGGTLSGYETEINKILSLNENDLLDDNNIPEPIKNIIQSMIDGNVQRKTVKIKNDKLFDRFLSDAKPAIDKKLLIIKKNPIDDKEVWFSLGPKAQSYITENDGEDYEDIPYGKDIESGVEDYEEIEKLKQQYGYNNRFKKKDIKEIAKDINSKITDFKMNADKVKNSVKNVKDDLTKAVGDEDEASSIITSFLLNKDDEDSITERKVIKKISLKNIK
jgi:hypothetical protein